jgi:hypothetical protein
LHCAFSVYPLFSREIFTDCFIENPRKRENPAQSLQPNDACATATTGVSVAAA